jgi:hypothetical protein
VLSAVFAWRGGGYVFVQAEEGENGNGSLVEAESREWDYHVKRFLVKV